MGPDLPLPRPPRRDRSRTTRRSSSSPTTRRPTSGCCNLRPGHAARGLRGRRHVRHQQRVRLRLPARQHGRGARPAGPARALLRDRRRGRQHPHRRGPHAAHHLRRRPRNRATCTTRSPGSCRASRVGPRAPRRAATTSSTSRSTAVSAHRGGHRQDGEAARHRQPVRRTDPRLPRHFEQALRAHALYKRDRDYIVKDGEIVIVDEFTGRQMPGRRWSRGPPPGRRGQGRACASSASRVTLATITFQNYFRLYDKLAGMTGTAMTEAEEFYKIYKLEVVAIPTHRPMIRDDYAGPRLPRRGGQVQRGHRRDRRDAGAGRPVLVGTVSVEKSEMLGSHAQAARRSSTRSSTPSSTSGRRTSSPRPGAAAR